MRYSQKVGGALVMAALITLSASADITPNGTVFTQGGDPSDDGPVNPTTGDLIIPATDTVFIQDLSSLLVDGGSLLQAGGISSALTGNAAFTVTGTGTRVDLLGTGNRLILIGNSTASIFDGAVLNANNPTGCIFSTCNVQVGSRSGSDATLTVSGTGSILNATSAIVVGIANVVATPLADSSGRLVIENGGVVNGDRSAFAQGTFNDPSGTLVSRGFLEVRGAGSQFNVNEIIFGNNIAPVNAGVSVVTIENQGAVNVNGPIVASLGVDTDTTIDVLTGGSLNALALYGSRGAGSTSIITFDGATTTGNFGDELIIGQGSTSSLSILNGATVNIGGGTDTGFTGSQLGFGVQGGTGTGLIDGSTVIIGPNTVLPEVRLHIGRQGGSGQLTVQNGAQLRLEDLTGGLGLVGDAIEVGVSSGTPTDGLLTITGAGTVVSVESIDLAALIIGVAGGGAPAPAVGVVNILDGAEVTVRGTGFNSGINIGRGANSDGTLNVSGTGTLVNIQGPQGIIAVGANFGGEIGDGDALMTVTDNAVVNLSGLTPNQGFFSVGNGSGTGLLQVNTGGTVNIDGRLRISVANSGGNTQTGSVEIGAGGTIIANLVEMGDRGTLTGDGTLVANQLFVGSGASVDLTDISSVAELILAGGSYTSSDDPFQLGVGGDQLVDISGGGSLSAPGDVEIGGFGSAVTVSIFDAGSLFDAGGDVLVNDSLVLNNGGAFTTTGNFLIETGGRVSGDGGSLTALVTTVGTGGTLAPGNTPGILDITGDLVLDGGTLEFEIAGANPGEFDQINVDGDVDLLNGTLSVALLNGFNPGGQSFDLISATGTLDIGTGVTLLNAGPGPDFTVDVTSSGVFNLATLTFTARDIAAAPGLNEKQLNMALYLDDLCPRIEGLTSPGAAALDLDARCGSLRSGSTTDAQVISALDQITPDEVIASFNSLLRFSQLQHGNLSRRLNGLRSGASRVDLSNLQIITDNASISGANLQRLADALNSSNFGRWGFFTEGRVNFGERDLTSAAPGYDFETVAITAGTDYKLQDNLYLGVALGFNEVNADYDVGGGMLMQSYSLSLLGTYFQGDTFYVDGLLTYTWNDIETDRRIFYSDSGGPVARKARGDTDGDSLSAGVGTGMDFTQGRWVWGPHAGFNYSDTTVDAFNETGALGLNLAMPGTNTESMTVNAGVHASYTLTPSWGVVVPYAQVDYIREFENTSGDERIRFVQDTFARDPLAPTEPVRVSNGGIDPNYVSWAVGVHVQFIRGIAAFIDYRGTVGLNDLDINEIAAGIRFERRLP